MTSLTVEKIIESEAGPELWAEISNDSNFSNLLLIAEMAYDSGVLGDDYSLAIALKFLNDYIVSHQRGGAGGALISEKEGQYSRSYAGGDSPVKPGNLNATGYGQRLQLLLKKHVSGIGNNITGFFVA